MHTKATALLVSTGVAGLLAGGVLMGTTSANAADSSSAGSSSSSSTPGPPPAANGPSNGNTDPTKPMRSDEHLLTGDTLAQVTAAVKAKYPGATFQRVETDSDGVYEAHLLVSGKPVTVEVNKSYELTGTEAAPPGTPGDHDGDGPAGQAPAA
jgi:hypothetical protein